MATVLDVDEVRFRPSPRPGHVLGWASCVLNRAVFLNNIAVVRDHAGRLRLTYPFLRSHGDVRHFHFSPITRDAQRAFDDAILQRLPLTPSDPVAERG